MSHADELDQSVRDWLRRKKEAAERRRALLEAEAREKLLKAVAWLVITFGFAVVHLVDVWTRTLLM